MTEFFKELENTQPDLLGPTHQRLIMHCLSETNIPHDPEMLSRLEDGLSRWLIFECDLTGSPVLAEESEFPGRAFYGAIESTCRSDYDKIFVLDAFDKYNKFDAFSSETTIMKMMEIMQDIKRTESIRMKASLALRNQSKLPEQAAINLIELIQNVDTATDLRGYLSDALGRQSTLSQENIIKLERLINEYEGENQEIRIAAVKALESESNLSEDTVLSLITMFHQDTLFGRYGHATDMFKKILKKQSNLLERTIVSLASPIEYESELPIMESDFRAEALELFGERSDLSEQTIVALIQLLGDEHEGIRSRAASALQTQSNLSLENLHALEVLLEKADGGIHSSAARVLGAFSPLSEQVVVALIRRLEVRSFGYVYQRNAAFALQAQKNLSEESVMALIQLIQNDSMRSHVRNILSIQLQLSEQAIAKLEQIVRDAEGHIRNIVAQAPRLEGPIPLSGFSMHELDFQRWWRAFGEHLHDIDYYWRLDLCGIGSLKGKSPSRHSSTRHLSEETTMVFLTALFLGTDVPLDSSRKLRLWGILESQSNLPDLAVKTLIAHLKFLGDYRFQEGIILLLGRMRALSDDEVGALVRLLKELDTQIRYLTLDTIAQQSKLSKESAEAFIELFESADQNVQCDMFDKAGEGTSLLEKLLEALESSTAPRTLTLTSQAMKFLYGWSLRVSIKEQIYLRMNRDDPKGSLCLHLQNVSRTIISDCSASQEQTLEEVRKWQRFWGTPDCE